MTENLRDYVSKHLDQLGRWLANDAMALVKVVNGPMFDEILNHTVGIRASTRKSTESVESDGNACNFATDTFFAVGVKECARCKTSLPLDYEPEKWFDYQNADIYDAKNTGVLLVHMSFLCSFDCFMDLWSENERNSMCQEHRKKSVTVKLYRGPEMKANIDKTVCWSCKKKLETPKQCTRCKQASYCDRTCQVDHWKEGHKIWCDDLGFDQVFRANKEKVMSFIKHQH